ncbi:hypothetical protein pdam_00014652 [Pocillopora damicornis]|uniref:Uncharacterized protein n=1 Tax=Pocillopora damicornis TaxID=46731 RepID=A0A3M6TLZ2_POCDA|nr:hypothetical protein pdam_00014652 [Pocillopora damicornis]
MPLRGSPISTAPYDNQEIQLLERNAKAKACSFSSRANSKPASTPSLDIGQKFKDLSTAEFVMASWTSQIPKHPTNKH